MVGEKHCFSIHVKALLIYVISKNFMYTYLFHSFSHFLFLFLLFLFLFFFPLCFILFYFCVWAVASINDNTCQGSL